MGVTYLVVAPEHPLVDALTTDEQREAVRAYVSRVAGKSDLERTSTGSERGKTGVPTGKLHHTWTNLLRKKVHF